MSQIEDRPVMKFSDAKGKVTNPGNKGIKRIYMKDNLIAVSDLLYLIGEELDSNQDLLLVHPNDPYKRKTLKGGTYYLNDLLVPIFKNGELVYDVPSFNEVRGFAKK